MSASKKTLLFSDVHLKVSEDNRAHREAFIAFLRQFDPQEYDRLICLGDLFDFWFEYKHVIFSEYFEVLRCFAEMREAGMELHLVCGNHDFWAGRFLESTLGFHIHQASVILPFGPYQGHLVHGDGVNPEDRAYRFYKRIARNPLVIRAFRMIHPDWAMALAQGVSHGSRTLRYVPDPAEGPESFALRRYAQGLLLEAGEVGVDIVACGHAHHPTLEAHPKAAGKGVYINTGDWIRHKSYVVWDGTAFHLEVEGDKACSQRLAMPVE